MARMFPSRRVGRYHNARSFGYAADGRVVDETFQDNVTGSTRVSTTATTGTTG